MIFDPYLIRKFKSIEWKSQTHINILVVAICRIVSFIVKLIDIQLYSYTVIQGDFFIVNQEQGCCELVFFALLRSPKASRD